MEATTAGKVRVSAGKRQLQRANSFARFLLQDPQLQQAVDRQWKRVSRNGIIEGIALKQMYKMICSPLFPRMPLARLEQLAHEKLIALSKGGIMEREGFIDFISELAEAVASQRGAAMLGRDAKAALVEALGLVHNFDNTMPLQSARIPVAGDAIGPSERNRRAVRVREGASHAGVVQATDSHESPVLIQSFARPPLASSPGKARHGRGGTNQLLLESVPGGARKLTPTKHADHDKSKPLETVSSPRLLLKSQSLRNMSSFDETADRSSTLAKWRRARSKQRAPRSSLQRSQTDPTLGGLHPVGSSSTDRHHRRPATCGWDTIMPKKQPVRLVSGQHSSSPLIRMSGDQAGQSVADDVPFEEWVAVGLPAHPKQSDSVRARQDRANGRISVRCCLCRKHARLWCDDCAAAFCAACWPGMPDHDIANLDGS